MRTGQAATVARSALAYATVVFAAGFVLGAIRTIWIMPMTGPFGAVLLELPLMILWSWFACRRVLARFSVPPLVHVRFAMGCASLLLLLSAEFLLSILLSGGGWQGFAAGLAQPEGLAGLCGQILFALMPLILIRHGRQ